jgi:hypothetical protein
MMWIRILEVSQWTAGKATGRLVGLALVLALAPFGPMACVHRRAPLPEESACRNEKAIETDMIFLTPHGQVPEHACSMEGVKIKIVNLCTKKLGLELITGVLNGPSRTVAFDLEPSAREVQSPAAGLYNLNFRGCEDPQIPDVPMTGTLEVDPFQ